MSVIQEKTDKAIMLQAIVRNQNGANVDQPANFPKVNIFKVEDSGVTEVLVPTVMTEHLPGEYYYEWEGSSVEATYKARYEVKVDEISFFGQDFIILETPSGVYDGEGA